MCTGGQPASVPAGTVTGVSRGIGKTQQAILAELTDAKDYRWLDIATLTERIGCSGRQIHQAVRSLERRGLVVITREHLGWKGLGEYGREQCREMHTHGPEVPTSRVIRKGEPWHRGRGYIARRDTELVRGGMPTWGLAVWLPENRITYLEGCLKLQRAFGSNSTEVRAELQSLTGSPPAPATFTIPAVKKAVRRRLTT